VSTINLESKEEYMTPVPTEVKDDVTDQLTRRITDIQTGNAELELEAIRLKTQTDEDKSRLNASQLVIKDFFTRISELEEQMQRLQLQNSMTKSTTVLSPPKQCSSTPKKIIITEIKNMSTVLP